MVYWLTKYNRYSVVDVLYWHICLPYTGLRPPPPTDLQTLTITTTSIDLDWSKPMTHASVKGYRIYYKAATESTYKNVRNTWNSAFCFFNVSNSCKNGWNKHFKYVCIMHVVDTQISDYFFKLCLLISRCTCMSCLIL